MVYENPLPLVSDFSDSLTNISFSIGILLLSAITLIAIYREQSPPKDQWCEVPNDEYNFMADSSSEQSRLDLAQAYIDMDQHHDATIILQQLLHSDNPIIKEASKQLLRRLA